MPDYGVTSFTIKGYEKIDRMLRTLDTKVARKVSRQAMRAGAKIVEAQAEANAPVGKPYTRKGKEHKPKTLKRSIKIRAFKKNRKGRIGFNVGTSGGDNLFAGEAFYGGFQELGYRVGKRTNEVKRAQTARNKALRSGDNAAIAGAQSHIESVDHRTKVVRGKRFMYRAYLAKGKQATDVIGQKLLEGVIREAKT